MNINLIGNGGTRTGDRSVVFESFGDAEHTDIYLSTTQEAERNRSFKLTGSCQPGH